jgi:hypothetical protein
MLIVLVVVAVAYAGKRTRAMAAKGEAPLITPQAFAALAGGALLLAFLINR